MCFRYKIYINYVVGAENHIGSLIGDSFLLGGTYSLLNMFHKYSRIINIDIIKSTIRDLRSQYSLIFYYSPLFVGDLVLKMKVFHKETWRIIEILIDVKLYYGALDMDWIFQIK